MDYIELDRKISETFKLPQRCVFVLDLHRNGSLLEYAYPPQPKGNMLPVDNKNIAGRAAIARRSYISNNVREEKRLVILDWLMSIGGAPIQKMITYPVIFADKVIAVLQVTRRGMTLSDAGPNFQTEDLDRIKSLLDDLFMLHAVRLASAE
jgi:GAF domain-containing protein